MDLFILKTWLESKLLKDDTGVADQTRRIAQELIVNDKVAFIAGFSLTPLALAVAPLHKTFGIKRAIVTTMQALSGASYPGVPSLDALDNVVPYIGGEEEKVVAETNTPTIFVTAGTSKGWC